jgi:uncharacterized protein (DUF1778 family)
MNKQDSITFRASKQEKSLIKKKADDAGMKMSDFIRTCCLGSRITTIVEKNT